MSDFSEILYEEAEQHAAKGHVTKTAIFLKSKMADGRHFEIVNAPHINHKVSDFDEIMGGGILLFQKCFDHNSARNYLILVKFCVMMRNHILIRLHDQNSNFRKLKMVDGYGSFKVIGNGTI